MPNTVTSDDMEQYNHPDSWPDVTLYSTITTDDTVRYKYTLVEIKYCVDTKPQDQHANAHAQHALLMEALESSPNTDVKFIVILLGTAGYIYQDTHDQLQKLGIQGRSLSSLITNLHIQAVKSLTSIIGARRHNERKQQQRKQYYSASQPNRHPTKPSDKPNQSARPPAVSSNKKCKKQHTVKHPSRRKKRKKR
jgi:hypothetical protein